MSHTEDKEADPTHPAANLGTVVVNFEDILSVFRRNRRDRDENRTHVLRITPPFEGERTAAPYVSESGNYYPPELSPNPIHLSPAQFVGEGGRPDIPAECHTPDYNEQRTLFLDERGYVHEDSGDYLEWTDKMESEFDDWWATVEDIFESNVRNALVDELTLQYQTHEGWVRTTIDVQYEDLDD